MLKPYLLLTAQLLFVCTLASAYNEVLPFSNFPDSKTCEASKLILFSDTTAKIGLVTVNVLDRDLPTLRLEVLSGEYKLVVIGSGHVGTLHRNNIERCGFLTTQSTTTHYTCGIYDGPRQPTYLDWKRDGRNTLARPDRICTGVYCLLLQDCLIK